MLNRKIVLCSASPRRKQLLTEIGLAVKTLVKDIDENFPAHLKEAKIAEFLAVKKADAFKQDIQYGEIFLTADTIVWLDSDALHEKGKGGKMLGKPVDAMDAFKMLRELSGRTHQVYTGICLSSIEKRIVFSVRSDVKFREIKDAEINYYVQHYEPFDKAGSYGAQECLPENMYPCSEEESKFLQSIHNDDLFERTKLKNKKHMPIIEQITGSYFNVMGLPLVETFEQLEKF